jgi:hypothetical protein
MKRVGPRLGRGTIRLRRGFNGVARKSALRISVAVGGNLAHTSQSNGPICAFGGHEKPALVSLRVTYIFRKEWSMEADASSRRSSPREDSPSNGAPKVELDTLARAGSFRRNH